MEGNIFGSVLDLSALLGDGGLVEGELCESALEGLEGEAFMRELGEPATELDGMEQLSKVFPDRASSHDSHLTGMGYDSGNNEVSNLPQTSAPLQLAADGLQSQMWGMQQTGPAPFKQNSPEGVPNAASLLTQLLSVIQGHATPKPIPVSSGMQEDVPVSQSDMMPSAPKAGGSVSLPNLSAQQQRTLQTIMTLGSVGSTPEGKKVRRMLSNRESARRSRHRKQAHMHELEEKVVIMENENEAMKLALAKVAEQEMQHTATRLKLEAEIAMLRSKVSLMEQAGSSGGPVKSVLAGSNTSTKAESLSFDSCCGSMPNEPLSQTADHEHSSKKRKTITNQQ